jgi:hypothetical protein
LNFIENTWNADGQLQTNKRLGFSHLTDNLGALGDIWAQISTWSYDLFLLI